MADQLNDEQRKMIAILEGEATMFGLDPFLIKGIARVESNFNPFVCRYEPGFAWPFKVDEWARKLLQSHDTEYVQQSTSWGAMQVMGAVAREFGFAGYLTQLSLPAVGARYAVKKLESLLKRYASVDDVIAAYNAGSPRMGADGRYSNQMYVDNVKFHMNKLREG